MRRQEITKGGRSVLHDFDVGVEQRYGDAAPLVVEAVEDYIAALPLAARTKNGIFVSHSLPDPLLMDTFDLTVFERDLTENDLSPGGPAYALVWGRFHSAAVIEKFARTLGVDWFMVGHTPQEQGYATIGRLMILASDHSHGVFLPLDLKRAYEAEDLVRSIRKFVSVE